ncbi:hypothetical protein [Halorussus salinisoli]|uniref:hypothetical protein n=1 Tax=Halorussus salinisoli TaxID=2558242 RepID=UPI0010C1C97A|nr:hypothetical protein [Halorussus salinisoli]
MNPTETVEDYYEALRRSDPLSPFFAERDDVVKFGISERLGGYESVAEGLREQTRATEDWQVESRALEVVERGSEEVAGRKSEEAVGSESEEAVGSESEEAAGSESVAWFTDDVGLSWIDSDGERQSFDTRWSGVLEIESGRSGAHESESDEGDERRWRFVQMHVSAPHDL